MTLWKRSAAAAAWIALALVILLLIVEVPRVVPVAPADGGTVVHIPGGCVYVSQLGATVADSSDGRVYAIPRYFTGSVLVLAAGSGEIVGHLSVMGAPDALALDPATGDLYVGLSGLSQDVAVYSVATGAFVTNLSGIPSTDSIAYDPSSGDLFASGTDGQAVTVIDGGSASILGSIVVSASPYVTYGHQLAYDGWDDDLYVAGADNLTIVNLSSASVAGAIPLPGAPDGIAVADSGHRVFVTDPQGSAVFVINASSRALLGTIALPAGSLPGSASYDSTDGDVYIADSGADEVTVLNASTDIVVAQVGTGAGPDSIAFASGQAFVTNFASGNVTEVSTHTDRTLRSVHAADLFPVTLSETGLPAGTLWSSSMYSPDAACEFLSQDSAGPSATYFVPNGSQDFTVLGLAGYVVSPTEGAVSVTGAPEATAVAFRAASSPAPAVAGWQRVAVSPLVVGPSAFVAGLLVAAAVVRYRRRWREEAGDEPPK